MDLRSVLACPRCKGPLAMSERACVCDRCDVRYPIAAGIPRLADDARTRDPRLAAEYEAQSNARHMYGDEGSIMNRWEEEVLPELIDWLDEARGPVLDVGCGTGFLGRGLAAQGRRVDLVGLDFHAELLSDVQPGWYAGLIEADAHRLPIKDGVFSAVIASNALHHLADPPVAVREIARVLAPGGTFIAYDPRYVTPLEVAKKLVRRGNSAFTDDHKAFTPAQYRGFFEQAGLRLIDLETRNPLGPLVATGLDFLKVGRRFGLAARVARGLVAMDRLLAGKDARSRLGLMVAARAIKD